jgi:acetolactate synthase I/II/III large subunit
MNHSFPEKVWRGQYSLGEPDLAKFSEGLGARAIVVDETQGTEDFRKALRLALRLADTENKPYVVVVKIDTTAEPPYGFGRVEDTIQP